MTRPLDTPALDKASWDERAWNIIQHQSDYIEFDWFAVDREGAVGAFCSFGVGPSPWCARSSRALYSELTRLISELPQLTPPIRDTSAYGDASAWEDYAVRGLYAYDYGDVHRTSPLERYELMARPQRAITLSSLALPERLKAVIPELSLSFSQSSHVAFAAIPK